MGLDMRSYTSRYSYWSIHSTLHVPSSSYSYNCANGYYCTLNQCVAMQCEREQEFNCSYCKSHEKQQGCCSATSPPAHSSSAAVRCTIETQTCDEHASLYHMVQLYAALAVYSMTCTRHTRNRICCKCELEKNAGGCPDEWLQHVWHWPETQHWLDWSVHCDCSR